MGEKDAEHLMACFRKQLLRVARVRHRLPFLRVTSSTLSLTLTGDVLDLLETDVPKIRVRNISDEDPPYFENAFPLVRSPDGAASGVIYRREHFGHSTEMTTVLDQYQCKPVGEIGFTSC